MGGIPEHCGGTARVFGSAREIDLVWLRRLLRRRRKYRMKVFAVAQEFEVNAWKIAGEGGLRRAFTVLYLGSSAYQLSRISRIKPTRTASGVFRSCPLPVPGGYEKSVTKICGGLSG
jgi:hypothetical protein